MAQTVDVDKIWTNLGRTGRYQIFQSLTCLVACTGCSIHLFSIVFLGYRPTYQCKPADENETILGTQATTVQYEYEQCTTIKTTNVSGTVTLSETKCEHGWDYFDDGVFSPDRSVVSEWNLVCGKDELTELTQTLVMVGQAFGAIVFTSLSDRFGRKKVHVLSHIMMFLVAATTALSPNYATFAAMRILLGAFQQGTELTLAILNVERFPMEIRFLVEVAGLTFWTTGIAIVTPIAYIFKDMSWRYFQLCLACMSTWSLVQWWLTDESLRWLIANGRLKDAKRILHKACKMNKKDYQTVVEGTGFFGLEMGVASTGNGKPVPGNDVVLLNADNAGHANIDPYAFEQDGVVHISTKRYTVVDLLKSRRLLISSAILWFTWITNSLTYYGIMLISSSLAGNRFLNFFFGSVVEYPAAFTEYFVLNRFGRKPAVIGFNGICGTALIAATLLTTNADGNASMLIGATVLTLIGKFAITGSFSTIFLYTPELYPTNMRNVGLGLASTAARFGGMVAPFSRNLAQTALWAPGLIFGCMCVFVTILMFWIPETNQYELPQTLEETEQWYRDNRLRLPCFRGKASESQRRRKVGKEVEIPPTITEASTVNLNKCH